MPSFVENGLFPRKKILKGFYIFCHGVRPSWSYGHHHVNKFHFLVHKGYIQNLVEHDSHVVSIKTKVLIFYM